MNGFDDRRDDPTTPGRPAGPPTPRQQPFGAPRFASAASGDDAEGASRLNAGAQPEAPRQSSPWQPSGVDEGGRPAVTPWQRGAEDQFSGHASGWRPLNSNEPAPTSQLPGTGDGGASPYPWQPDPATQWPPNEEPAPTLQWQPGGQSDPATSWMPDAGSAANTPALTDPTLLGPAPGGRQPEPAPPGQGGRNDPTMLARSLGQPPSGQWPPQTEPVPGVHGHNDPTMLGQPLGALDQHGPFGRRGQSPVPSDSAPTLLGYSNAGSFGPPAQISQWQPGGGPGQYGPAPDGRYQLGPQGGFPAPPPQQNSPRGKLVLSAGLVALLVVGLVAGAVALTTMKSDDSAQDTPPSMVSALTTTTAAANSTAPATTKPAPTTTARGSADKTPLIPGFQVVKAPDSGAAYDVPADWTIAPQGTIGGFGEPPNAVAGKGLASEGKGYCPGSTRTVAFLTGSNTSDPGKAATELGTKTATLAYKATSGSNPGLPMPLASLDGSQHGMFVETKGTVADAKPGCAKAYSVYTAAFPNDNGTFVMVIAADTGVPHALDAETAKRIFTSIRPLEG
ncbi:hypothetical protein LTT66_14410 [Nocardia gipuzkoensis]|uniref:hypothetical protein n=1 Tax=Nocardia gipuzkoensis TaxID=2749991 RepID=UPI001E5976E6|nr:hypothetical protein [Nocardia gipuzkoensis]UGT71229.1 hypothetical protein LTT66_14410 [Nocardia gipuzkoensis]